MDNCRTWFSSNYRRSAVDAGIGYVFVERDDWWEWNYDAEVRFRVDDRLFIIPKWNQVSKQCEALLLSLDSHQKV